jgi:dipeptidyl aminopeptidase/acylaminoacyl peptidase
MISMTLGITSWIHAQAKVPVTHEALWLMPRVGAPVPSPDGKSIVFSVIEPAYEEKDQSSDIWIVPSDGSAQPRRITSTKAAESDIVWSSDSRRIAFVTRRENDDAGQIYVLDLVGGGEATRVTSISTGASNPKWRSDGKALLFSSLVYPNAADDEANRRIAAERKNAKYNVRTFDTFLTRRWDHWLDDRQVHVLVQNLEPGAKSIDLIAGTKLVRNPGYGGRVVDTEIDQLDAVWAPNGQSIVFVATTGRDKAAHATVQRNLYEVAASGGEPRQLTTTGNFSYQQPRFSPIGNVLYFTINNDHDQVYSLNQLGSAQWPWTGSYTVLTAKLDRSVSSFAPSADGRTVYLTAEDAGLEKLYVTSAGGGDARLAVAPPRGVYTNVAIASLAVDSVMVANWASATEPAEIVRIDPATKQHRLLTRFAVDRAAQLDWQPVQHFTFTSRGKSIHNMIVLPSGFDASRKYPLLVSIHGGPANMWRDEISLRWNYHLLARPGYVVLLTNYTGSTGFGEKFARDIQRDPFAGPANEINEAADEAIRRFPFIDGSRQAAVGASYGGHLINWLQATTTRYRCLVAHAGLVDSQAQWGTSDSIYDRELMNGGPPWEMAETWLQQNPIRRAAGFKTPILLSAGERDFRVPLNNTLENWSALQRMEVPSRLLVWPTENHWILNGENSRYFYGELHAWLARWLT